MCAARRSGSPASARSVSTSSKCGGGSPSTAALSSTSRYSAEASEPQVMPEPAPYSTRAGLAVDDRGPDRDREGRVAAGSHDADRSAVDTARRALQRGDEAHRAGLRRAGHRAAREERAEDLDEPRPRPRGRGHGGSHLQHGRVALDRAQRRHGDAPGHGHAPEVAPHQVDDHHVLGAVLLRPAERRGAGVVLVDEAAAPRRALHRAHDETVPFPSEEQLRGGRGDARTVPGRGRPHSRRAAAPPGAAKAHGGRPRTAPRDAA